MLCKRIVPCLDIKGERVVKGVQFGNLRDAGDPVACARLYEAQGADEIVLLDIAATGEGRSARVKLVSAIRDAISIPLCVGGGVRNLRQATELLQAGADKVVLNTAAVERPPLLQEMSEQFGAQCTVLALDAAVSCARPSGYEVVTKSGTFKTGQDALAWARQAAALGAGEIIATSWDRDGTSFGYELGLLRLLSRDLQIPVVASGGAGQPEDLLEALRAGVDAVLAASMFHSGRTSVGHLKEFLAASGVLVRL